MDFQWEDRRTRRIFFSFSCSPIYRLNTTVSVSGRLAGLAISPTCTLTPHSLTQTQIKSPNAANPRRGGRSRKWLGIVRGRGITFDSLCIYAKSSPASDQTSWKWKSDTAQWPMLSEKRARLSRQYLQFYDWLNMTDDHWKSHFPQCINDSVRWPHGFLAQNVCHHPHWHKKITKLCFKKEDGHLQFWKSMCAITPMERTLALLQLTDFGSDMERKRAKTDN